MNGRNGVVSAPERRTGRLDGRVALVTGAARGIGRACACVLAEEGAALVLVDVAEEVKGCTYPLGTAAQLRTTATLCGDRGASTVALHGDVRSTEDMAAVVDTVLDRYGRVDVLVNNAGLAAPAGLPAHGLTEEQWQLMMDVDLSGPWRVLRLVVPHMVDRGAGSVVNVASTAGLVGYPHFANYTAAKHGLVGLTRAAALDYARHGVRINALCPGSVRDEHEWEGRMLDGIAEALGVPAEDRERVFEEGQPSGQLVSAREVASACCWLASDDSRGVTGAVIAVDGGYSAR